MSPLEISIKSVKQSYCIPITCMLMKTVHTNKLNHDTHVYYHTYLYSYLQQQYTKSIENVDIIHHNFQHFHAPSYLGSVARLSW